MRTSGGVYTTINAPDNFACGYSINATGQIAGYMALTAHGLGSASWLWANGSFTKIDAPLSKATDASSINGSGDITGSVLNFSGVHGFLRTPDGKLTVFDVVKANPALTQGFAINDSGVITGITGTDPFTDEHGFVRFP